MMIQLSRKAQRRVVAVFGCRLWCRIASVTECPRSLFVSYRSAIQIGKLGTAINEVAFENTLNCSVDLQTARHMSCS